LNNKKPTEIKSQSQASVQNKFGGTFKNTFADKPIPKAATKQATLNFFVKK
jgi:hypothetical protein